MTSRKLGQQGGPPLSKAMVLRAQLLSQSKKINTDTIIKIRDRRFVRLFLIHKNQITQALLDNVGTRKRRQL